MSINSQRVIDWRHRTKERMVQSFGGRCGICGYNRCQESMDMHHLDPTEKEFPLSSIRANPMSWKKIVVELRKCVMLCRNCHGEIHAGLVQIPDDIRRFDESFSDYKKLKSEDEKSGYLEPCRFCGKLKSKLSKTCSVGCAAKLKGTIDWNAFDLNQLYVVEKKSLNEISKIYGCSTSGVKKRLIKLKILP